LSGSRRSMGSSYGSRRSGGTGSISHSFRQPAGADDPFGRAASQQGLDDDEENLRWAALEKLPTYDRMRRAVLLNHAGAGGADGHELQGLVDIEQLASGEAGRALLERVFQDDSERFLRRLRDRVDRYYTLYKLCRSHRS
uniref:ABC-transporter N-terminal domain-containing protein n=1 Tax=Aegilops tauschii subsp. strangulata TaxID=200361 RepID=A0A453MN13_AEGTS